MPPNNASAAKMLAFGFAWGQLDLHTGTLRDGGILALPAGERDRIIARLYAFSDTGSHLPVGKTSMADTLEEIRRSFLSWWPLPDRAVSTAMAVNKS